ncbi:putative chaperone protein [Sinobacterium caligoides]|uniref:Putative chaperone protein n=1 Tax=Sinobacterium caligoides TaxID=933926 RepID=A0A3N2E0F1_9GAMM|nr:molecular chaperone [Sinobacterium caligoides]ROS05045.1 putative chaperone protein [Sinobacterium caligoides]
MISGFDYGTSNCAIGVLNNKDNQHSAVELLPLERGHAFIPSALYAIERELICENVARLIGNKTLQPDYLNLRSNQLNLARAVRSREGISADEQSLFIGLDAFDEYQAMTGEGYFVKSPKSFLGASGLRSEFLAFFEDIVTAMMQGIKQRAEKHLGDSITHTVIGRPVNFQGRDAEASNRQAIDILTIAAKRAGFQSIEFLFEPLAAGLDFEAKLTEDKTVLVVDVGGGTTDCAMVRMGPSFRDNELRENDFLGHSGERIGGNDLDIQLAGRSLMPVFGMESLLKNGLPMPTQTFWDAVSTNDVAAQTVFNSMQTEQRIQQWLLDSTEPELIQRLIKFRAEKQNYQLVRSAEQCKISLSDNMLCAVELSYIEEQLRCDVSREQFASAIERPLAKMTELMDEAILQAGQQPDLIYITGGSAKSPVIRQAIQQQLGDIEVVDGDHFGSVAAGLTVWANKVFR